MDKVDRLDKLDRLDRLGRLDRLDRLDPWAGTRTVVHVTIRVGTLSI